MIEDWLKLRFCNRVLGFWYGYQFQIGPPEDQIDPEFIRGWHEGVDLLFDERRAAAKEKNQ